MNRFLFAPILLLFFWLGSFLVLRAEQVEFLQGKWTDILSEAQSQNKPIFVEFYATWCAPCKYMKDKVFTHPEVGNYYNQNFVSFRINAESEEQVFVKKMKIDVFPTLLFLMPNGEIIGQQTGATEPDDLVRFGRAMHTIAQATGEVQELRMAYQQNPQNREVTAKYLQALMMANQGEAAQLVANNYLNTIALEDWQKRYNWRIISTFVTDTESKGFQYILENAEVFAQKYQDDFTAYILEILQDKLAQTTSAQDINELHKLKKMYLKAITAIGRKDYESAYYNDFIDLYFYKHSENSEKYFQTLIRWVDTYYTEDWQELSTRAFELSENANYLEKAYQWTKKALALENNIITNVTMAQVLHHMNQTEEALIFAQTALKINTEEDMKPYLERLISKLKKS